MPPKVSVLLGGYNQAPYLRQSVDSVLSQTFADLELIVIDNGSSDESPDILRSYASDPRVRLLLHPTNGPVTQRFNQAVATSTGEFLSLLYADDYYLPEKLERQVSTFSGLAPDYGLVHGPGYRHNVLTGEKWLERALPASGWIFPVMLREFFGAGSINPISPLMRRECLVGTPFREEVFGEWEAVFYRLALRWKFQYLADPLVVMQEHLQNSGKAIKVNRDLILYHLEKLRLESDFPADQLPALRRLQAKLLMSYGWQGVRVSDDPAWARDCFWRAVRTRPVQALHPRILAGLALSFSPAPLVRLLNGAANKLSRNKGNFAFRE